MTSTWRLLQDDRVSAAAGLAVDEAITRAVSRRASRPTLRLYTYRSHCALVGRFQNVASEVQLAFCRERAFAVNRRVTGGGTIIMGSDQLGVALAVPRSIPRPVGSSHRGLDREETSGGARALMARFSRGLVRGLEAFGIAAVFHGKNDLEVDGRKIAGLGIYRDRSGGLLFHGSLLVALDVELMLRVLKTPSASVTGATIRRVARRTATVRGELRSDVPLAEVRAAVAKGFASAFSIELADAALTAAERAAAEDLEHAKYRSREWVFQRTAVPDHAGFATTRTSGGRLEVRVTRTGRMLKAVSIGGDFFASDRSVADLEGSLRWHPDDAETVRATVGRVYLRRPDLGSLPRDALVDTILEAARSPREDPYGCFVRGGASE